MKEEGWEGTSRMVEMKTELELERMKKVTLRSLRAFKFLRARTMAGCY